MKAREFYNKSFVAYEERFRSPTMRHCRKKESELFRKYARGKILDLGCGTGFWTGRCFAGLDASEEMLKIARDRSGNLMLGDISRIPLKDESFDSVVLFFSVLNRDDFSKSIPEIRRITRKGGTLLLSLPSVYDNGYSYPEKRSIKNPPKNKTYHVKGHKSSLDLFTRQEVEGMFRKEGFAPVRFDSLFILNQPRWGNWNPDSPRERVNRFLERFYPKEYGCTYYFVFRKN